MVFAFSIGFSFSQKKRVSPKETTIGEIKGVEVNINYCAPSVKSRKIWGELVPYDKIWRAGANENTIITFSDDVKIEGNDLAAGSYGLHVHAGVNKNQPIAIEITPYRPYFRPLGNGALGPMRPTEGPG